MFFPATYVNATAFTTADEPDQRAACLPGTPIHADCGPDGPKRGRIAAVTPRGNVLTVTIIPDSDQDELTPRLVRLGTGPFPDCPALVSRTHQDTGRFPGLRPPTLNIFCGPDARDVVPAGVFSRSTPATRRGGAGFLETVAANAIRREWDAEGTLLGWRIEDARMNLTLYADKPQTSYRLAIENIVGTFQVGETLTSGNATAVLTDSAGGWLGVSNYPAGFRGTVCGNASNAEGVFASHQQIYIQSHMAFADDRTTAPDGLSLVRKMREMQDHSVIHSVCKEIRTTSGEHYTFSFYAKAGERSILSASIYHTVANHAVFDLATGAVAQGQGTMTPVGNGWYRCACSLAATAATATARLFLRKSENDILYDGDGVSGLYCWGVQIEIGRAPSSYIPTTATPVIRGADVWTVPLTPSWFTPMSGTIFLAARTAANAPAAEFVQVLSQYDDGTANNRLRIVRDSSRILRCTATAGGTEVANLSLGVVADLMSLRVAFSWSGTGYSACLDGGPCRTVSGVPAPIGLTMHRIGCNTAGAQQWCGQILQDAFFPATLADTVKQRITRATPPTGCCLVVE
jgi:hypothetical protein